MRRIGVALGSTRAWAVAHGGEPWSAEMTAGPGELIREMQQAFGERPAQLDVVLLPEICQAKRISLPHLSENERRAVLRRTLGRHFPRATGALAFGDQALPGGVMAAAASDEVVDGLEEAATARGWRIASVHTAISAWAAAAKPATRVFVATQRRLDVLLISGRHVTGIRRLPGALATPESVLELERSTEDHGRGPIRRIDSDAEVIAARYAHRARGPEVLSDAQFRRRGALIRRTRYVISGIAAALVVGAGLASRWGLERELAHLRAMRNEHAEAVARAFERQERVTLLEERATTLAGASRSWTAVVNDLSEHLPATTFLTAFRAIEDSVSLEGVARESGPLLEALRSATTLAAVRATQPIRRESRDGRTIERFVLSARLVRPEVLRP